MCFKFLHIAPLSYCYFEIFKIKLFIWSLNNVFALVHVCGHLFPMQYPLSNNIPGTRQMETSATYKTSND